MAGLWVKIPVDPAEGVTDAYYWNPAAQATRWVLPQGVDATWVAQKQNGVNYYWNTVTREVTWDVPGTGKATAAAHTASTGSPAAGAWKPPPTPSGWQFKTFFCGTGVPDGPSGAASEADVAAIGAAANPQDANAAEVCFSREPRKWPHSYVTARSLSLTVKGAGTGKTETVNWVEVEADEETATKQNFSRYFWNYVKGYTTWTLPPGVRARWRLHQTSEGDTYYADTETGQVTWQIPDMPVEQRLCSRWLEPGGAMMVKGLKESVQYNMQAGRVLSLQGDRVHIRLPDVLGGVVIAVPLRNVCPLEHGAIVELHGLSKTDLNGEVGTIVDQHPECCRYSVRMRDGTIKKVQAKNLLPRCRLWNIDLSACHTWLQWRKEQDLLFIDSCGQHRRFWMHLPCTFTSNQRGSASLEPPRRWPLMVYLHGTGGSSFFSHSKKTLRTNGLQFAAQNFVVVSPQCEWTWRESPKPWVAELVDALRAADWIDHRRVYLTGCSMGGMSTWEVSAMRSDLFAAIAPVAGHHQADRGAYIAQALRNTPVFVVASRHDETCPMRLEQILWSELDRCGNRRLQVNVADNIDHCSMYERAYCDDTSLYEWLLMFRDV